MYGTMKSPQCDFTMASSSTPAVSPLPPPTTATHSGYLYKQDNPPIRLFYVLRGTLLSCYDAPGDQKPKREVDVGGARIQNAGLSQTGRTKIMVRTRRDGGAASKIYHMESENALEAQQWVRALELAAAVRSRDPSTASTASGPMGSPASGSQRNTSTSHAPSTPPVPSTPEAPSSAQPNTSRYASPAAQSNPTTQPNPRAAASLPEGPGHSGTQSVVPADEEAQGHRKPTKEGELRIVMLRGQDLPATDRVPPGSAHP